MLIEKVIDHYIEIGNTRNPTNLPDREYGPKNQLLRKFRLGRVVATPGALRALKEGDQNPFEFLARHQAADWGELCEEDKRENEFSVRNGFRILSAYRTRNNTKIWVIAEADRSATTLLPPRNISAAKAPPYRGKKWAQHKDNEGALAIKQRLRHE